ncbi:MAG: FprA family A-type flavoprotein [Lachnospiraceae bacterium]|nr:FprA family A-type flavoprotein [Lachnospiraceae bacterium]
MHNVRTVNEDVIWLGASDRRIALFENAYPVPKGMSYNSYLIKDEKTCLMDGVDTAVLTKFMANLEFALGGRDLDYMVVQHMEPDHCAAIPALLSKYSNLKIVASQKALDMIKQFFDIDLGDKAMAIKEADTLNLGKHELKFFAAPMVHWPEVMVTYDAKDGLLFSADAFGEFGSLDGGIFADEVDWERDWLDEARRYYVNIVGKYGAQTLALLNKAKALDIKMILPLHGHIWRENLDLIIGKYQSWATYTPEENSVAIFYGSIYGNTENAAEILATKLSEKGVRNVRVYDVSKTDVSELVSKAFQYKALVFASATYNGEIFDGMHTLITDLKNHNLSKRTVALIDNGSWAAIAGKKMREMVESMKEMTVLEPVVSLKSAVSEANVAELEELADSLVDLLNQ